VLAPITPRSRTAREKARASEAREQRASLAGRLDGARERLMEIAAHLRETAKMEPEALGKRLAEEARAIPKDPQAIEARLYDLERDREAIGPVNLRAEEEAGEHAARLQIMHAERSDLTGAIARLRQ